MCTVYTSDSSFLPAMEELPEASPHDSHTNEANPERSFLHIRQCQGQSEWTPWYRPIRTRTSHVYHARESPLHRENNQEGSNPPTLTCVSLPGFARDIGYFSHGISCPTSLTSSGVAYAVLYQLYQSARRDGLKPRSFTSRLSSIAGWSKAGKEEWNLAANGDLLGNSWRYS
jgi:hypothetical protein